MPFTTNSLEAYNRHLNRVSSTNHPSIYSLVLELRKETEINIVKILTFELHGNENNQERTENTRKILTEEYGIVISINYLQKVAAKLKFGLDSN